MTQSVTVTLSLPPRALSPNSRPHWAAKAKAAKAHRGEAFLMTRHAMRQGQVLDTTGAVLVRPSFFHRVNRRRDRDNATASLKAALDGIAEALGMDDSGFVVAPVRFFVDKKDVRVVLELEGLRGDATPSETP